jgi:hypothetical protein
VPGIFLGGASIVRIFEAWKRFPNSGKSRVYWSENYDLNVKFKVLHDKPFRLAIENMITREPRSHDPRIFGQIVHIQHIFFKELHGLAMRIPKDEEIEHIVVRLNSPVPHSNLFVS